MTQKEEVMKFAVTMTFEQCMKELHVRGQIFTCERNHAQLLVEHLICMQVIRSL